MNLFKIIRSGEKVFIKMLTYNPRVWCNKQWFYGYVMDGAYPTENEKYATDFKTVEAAEQWIKDNEPQ